MFLGLSGVSVFWKHQSCFSAQWHEFRMFCAFISDKDVRPEIVGTGLDAGVVLSYSLTSLYPLIWRLLWTGALFIGCLYMLSTSASVFLFTDIPVTSLVLNSATWSCLHHLRNTLLLVDKPSFPFFMTQMLKCCKQASKESTAIFRYINLSCNIPFMSTSIILCA